MDDTQGKEKITIHGQFDMATTVENDQTNTVNNKLTETIKGAVTEKYESTMKTTVTDKVTLESMAEILIKAASKITLETGASKITLEAGGNIKIEGVSVLVSGQAKVETKGGMVVSEASATNTVKGAIVMVN
jgi:type VI secretion system secreted protein VgrG